MGFKPVVAPTKATVFPLVQKPALNDLAAKLSRELTAAGLSNLIDTTGEAGGAVQTGVVSEKHKGFACVRPHGVVGRGGGGWLADWPAGE